MAGSVDALCGGLMHGEWMPGWMNGCIDDECMGECSMDRLRIDAWMVGS